MLPAKIGDGVFGSNCGGVNPAGAAAVDASSAMALMVLVAMLVLIGLGLANATRDDCFHGTVTRSLGEERVGVKREA